MSGESPGQEVYRVDVNCASAKELGEKVLGIGGALAERIVDYRGEHGPFAALEDLVLVRGIGPQSLTKLLPQLSLGAPEGAAAEAREQMAALDTALAETGEEPNVLAGSSAMDSANLDATGAEATPPDAGAPDPEAEGASSEAPEPESSRAATPEEIAPEPMPQAPADLQTAEEVSRIGAEELEAEVAEVELEELGLYTRGSGSEPLTAWTSSEKLTLEDELVGSEPEAPFVAEQELEAATPKVIEPSEVQPESVAPVSDEPAPVATPAPPAREDEERTMAQEAARYSGPVGGTAEQERERPERRGGFWRGFGLVLLGGLLGVALTLAGAVIWSGTFDFAPRQEVDALSRNLNTMQANQELAWERVDQLTVSAEEMGRKVKQIESLTGRIGEMEAGLSAAKSDLVTAKSTLAELSGDLAELETSLETSMNKLDERVMATEDQLGAVTGQVATLEKVFGSVEDRIESIDGFFGALRDLLIELEGPAPASTRVGGASGSTPVAPKPTPTQ